MRTWVYACVRVREHLLVCAGCVGMCAGVCSYVHVLVRAFFWFVRVLKS